MKHPTIGTGLWFAFVQFITAMSILVTTICFVVRCRAMEGFIGGLR